MPLRGVVAHAAILGQATCVFLACRQRQGAITGALLEIVGGANAAG